MSDTDFVHHPHPLHECLQVQEHLTAQDRALARMLKRMEQLEGKMESAAG